MTSVLTKQEFKNRTKIEAIRDVLGESLGKNLKMWNRALFGVF